MDNKLDALINDSKEDINLLLSKQIEILSLVDKAEKLQKEYYELEKKINSKNNALSILFEEELSLKENDIKDYLDEQNSIISKKFDIRVKGESSINKLLLNINNIEKINLNYKLKNALPEKNKGKVNKI